MEAKAGSTIRLSRRAFLRNGTLLLAATAVDTSSLPAEPQEPQLRIGLVTDLHYADKPAAGSRHYRETPGKLAEAATRLAEHQLSFLVELGDFIDAADSPATELGYLTRINRQFSAICPNRHYVLGNHCVHTLTKQEFLGSVERERSFYSFDSGDFHFVVIDACFRSDSEPYGRRNFEWTDPNVPPHELEWLEADLQQSSRRTIAFVHQRLDVEDSYGVKNAPDVRRVLEGSGNVVAVLQGHSHANDYTEINGIHYCTLVAMVEGSGSENNGYSVMSLAGAGTIRIDGFRRQADYTWP